MELALGEFPYKKWNNIFEQLNAVVNGEPPRLSKDKFSRELCEFVAAWYVSSTPPILICMEIMIASTYCMEERFGKLTRFEHLVKQSLAN